MILAPGGISLSLLLRYMGGRGLSGACLVGTPAGHWGGRGADRVETGVLEVWPTGRTGTAAWNGEARWDRCAWLGCLRGSREVFA